MACYQLSMHELGFLLCFFSFSCCCPVDCWRPAESSAEAAWRRPPPMLHLDPRRPSRSEQFGARPKPQPSRSARRLDPQPHTSEPKAIPKKVAKAAAREELPMAPSGFLAKARPVAPPHPQPMPARPVAPPPQPTPARPAAPPQQTQPMPARCVAPPQRPQSMPAPQTTPPPYPRPTRNPDNVDAKPKVPQPPPKPLHPPKPWWPPAPPPAVAMSVSWKRPRLG